MSLLINYEWPGNIRELRNCIEYMILMEEITLTLDDLPSYMRYVPLVTVMTKKKPAGSI